MDQASFRQLLQTPTTLSSTSAAASSAHIRGSLLAKATAAGKKKQKTVDASQPAFKPRTLKKNKGEDYRDRAGERRLGVNNDFAQVEALAEDFERRHAEEEDRRAVDEQRKYLGGDSQHTVLVKGLDYALLEQNRARVAAEAAATEDVSLEQAFLESSVQPKKRTKAEILSELKSKRGAAGAAAPVEADKALEEAKKAGKFKPIGFKPVGSGAQKGAEGKVKRKKKVKAGEPEENGERKKKRKVAADATTAPASASVPSEQGGQASATPSGDVGKGAAVAGPSTAKPAAAPNPEPEPVDEDFDIFAGAGEYTGIDLGDDDEGSEVEDLKPRLPEDEEGGLRDGDALRPGKWLATSDDEREPTPPPPAASARDSKSATRSASPQRRPDALHRPPSPGEDGEMDEEAEDRPMRLQPLASSALPSIKDLLAMSEEAEKAEKRKARKEKKKSGGGGGGAGAASEKDTKAKIDRDYQRLKAYTDKKNKT